MRPWISGTRSVLTLVLLMPLVLVNSTALADPPAKFEARVESLRREIGVPGVSIAIVEDGHVALATGLGIRALGSPVAVDADTIFPNGSTGKAFTVAALAVLVDQGKIGWDDKVTDHLPWFQMYDPWVTREITIRDLLVHRSGLGLGAGDLLFVPRTNLTRAESVRRLRYIKPATSFRSGYAYDNMLYMVVGQLIEEVTGQTWETFTREHVLEPAGMRHSTTDDVRRFATADRAFPHARVNGPVRGVGELVLLDEHDELGRNGAPAGGMAVSANDMARWLMIQLNAGKLPDSDGRVFSEAAHRQMWNPVVATPAQGSTGPLAGITPKFSSYALGWSVQDYQGAKIVTHGGAVFGFHTIVTLIPEKRVGFSIIINSEDSELIVGLEYELLDHYLGRPANQWPEKFIAYKRDRLAKGMAAYQATVATPAKIGPSLPLARYVGTYTDPWYGNIEVTQDDKGLRINFASTPRMGGRLEHWQYDSFVTRLDDKAIEAAYVTFGLDADGKVERVTMKAVSPLADFSYDYQDLLFRPAQVRAR
jgi:CubicO group peptidase (beta-lactamase class C family)